MRKHLSFAKNVGIATIACIAGGVAGAELSDILVDSEGVIAAGSTAAQYAAWVGALLPLHLRDNTDLYYTPEHTFRWDAFLHDGAKMILGFGALDIIYVLARPLAHYHFQEQGNSPLTASLLADAVCLPAYYALAFPVAWYLGLLREEKSENHFKE